MKKTLKSILALTLALIMSFGTLSGFAAEGDTLEWIYDDEYSTEYTCYGEFKEGKNTVLCDEDGSEQKYYTFVAKEGYYSFSYTNPLDNGWIDWLGIPYKIENGKAYDFARTVFDSYNEGELGGDYSLVYKLDAGETIIGVDTYYSAENTKIDVNIEYLGKTITDFDISEKELLLNRDIYEGETESELYTHLSVTFDETKTIEFPNQFIIYSCDEIKAGENVLTFEIEGLTKDITVIANPIEYYIKDIELHNAEHYAQIFVDYNNDTWYYDIDGAVATVTFANGSEKDIFFHGECADVTLSNRKTYAVFAYHHYSYDDGERYLSLYIGDYEKNYKCAEIKYDIIENGEILVEDNKSEIADFLNCLYWELDNATYYNTTFEIFESLFGSFFDTLINASDLFGGIFENIVRFIKFYLVG